MLRYWKCSNPATWKKRCRSQSRRKVDVVKTDDEGLEFVKCRPVARDFKPRRDGPRDDSFAAMPPLESKKRCSLT